MARPRRLRHINDDDNGAFRLSLRRLFRTKTIIVSLVCVAFFPPIFFHFRLTRLNRIQLRKCGWLNAPPLVCAHGGDSANAFPNTFGAYELALRHQVDCVEIDASRSSDGVLFALHDRDLQRMSGNGSLRVGNLNAKEIKELGSVRRPSQKFDASKIPTIEEALKLVSSSVKQVILDAKVGPPFYEKRLAKDIISVIRIKLSQTKKLEQTNDTAQEALDLVAGVMFLDFQTTLSQAKSLYTRNGVERTQCRTCLVWAKSDSLARDVMKQSPDTMVGYIVMLDPSTGLRTNILRMRDASVVGVYHPLIDEKLVQVLHRRNKKVYAWTVDDADSMQNMLFERVDGVVTSDPTLLQTQMQELRTQCLEEGFSFSQ